MDEMSIKLVSGSPLYVTARIGVKVLVQLISDCMYMSSGLYKLWPVALKGLSCRSFTLPL